MWLSPRVIRFSFTTTQTKTKDLMCLCSFNVSFVTEPPHDLDPHMRTKTRPRWKSPHDNTDIQIFGTHALLINLIILVVFSPRSYSSASIEDAMKKAEEPPTPPPRPQKTHSRASSLDLNKLFQQGAPGTTHTHGLCASSLSSSHNMHELPGATVHFATELLFCLWQFSFHGRTKGEMEIGGFYCLVWKVRGSQQCKSVCDYENMALFKVKCDSWEQIEI